MHALVTGGAGFIGSHLCARLLAAGHRVSAVDNLSTGIRRNVAGPLTHERFRLVCDDIRTCELLPELVRDCDLVFHLAASVGVRLVVDRSIDSIANNFEGTAAVLKQADRFGRKVLFTSTSEVYGKSEHMPFREDGDLLIGCPRIARWNYALSKAVDESLVLAHHRERGLPATVVRLFNTVGPGQSGQYGMVVPRFVRAALAGEALTVYGTGEQTRCFCDVSDVVEALVGLADEPSAIGGIFNIGSDAEISINDLAKKVLLETRSKSPVRRIGYEEAYGASFEDMPRRVPDTSKVRCTIGWRPKRTLDETIRAIADHLRRGVA